MTAIAHLLKDGAGQVHSLNPASWSDYYHVVGIEGWTPGNTIEKVFSTLPPRGSVHPESAEPATVVAHRLIEKINRPAGTYPDGVGGADVTYTEVTNEAICAVEWSSRQPFSLVSIYQRSDRSEFSRIRLPAWSIMQPAQGDPLYFRRNIWVARAIHYRSRRVNATGITEAEQSVIEGLIGRLVYFPLPTFPGAGFNPNTHSVWVLAAANLERNRFNQDLLTYRFMTTGPLLGSDEYDIAIPPLNWLEEWDQAETQDTSSDPGVVEVRTAAEVYPAVGNSAGPPVNFYNLPRV